MRKLIIIGIILLAAFSRLIPHPPNFTPIIAIALLGGASIKEKYLAFIIPVFAMFIADLILGFHQTMIWGYTAMLLIASLGILIRHNKSIYTIGIHSAFGSIIFFLLSNFGVWITGMMYTKSFAGLATCYIAGLPFFANTLAGTIMYGAILFGGLAILEKLFFQMQTETIH